MVEIICHPYASHYEDEDGQIESGFHMWCLDRESTPIHVHIKNPPIYCYLELPEYINNARFDWGQDSLDILHLEWKKMMRNICPIMVEFTSKQKLYYFKGKNIKNEALKSPMARIFFNNTKSMNIFCFKVKKPIDYENFGTLFFQNFEKDISIRRKIFSIRNSKYSQWIKIKGHEIFQDDSSRQAEKGIGIREILLDSYKDITPINVNYPPTNPKIVSFDIETYTDNHNAMPNENNPDHVVYMISIIYQATGLKDTRKRYVILFGDCKDIEGVEIIRVNSEESLLEKFQDLILELDPEIIMGYNIFSYDYPYIDVRNIRNGMKDWKNISRINGYTPKMYRNEWKSSGYGNNRIFYLDMPGRITIDLLPLIRRDYKFSKYSLDFVSKELLGVGKHDVSAKEMFKAYESKDINEMTRVTKYCVQDSELVLDLYEKMNVWIGLVEMSSIVGVEIMDLYTRGQQVRCVSQLYDLTSHKNIIHDSRDVPKINYEGGFVGNPLLGIHDNVICLDFASLYPSIMMGYNICYTTLVSPSIQDEIPDEMCNVIKVDDTTTYRFVKAEVFPGVLPELVSKLVTERKSVKKQLEELEETIKKSKDDSEIKDLILISKVLDKRQNGLKVSANSIYGFLGVQEGGKLPLIEGARAITARGRQMICEVNSYLEKKYNALIVYNDTDSSMVQIPCIKSSKECNEWGKYLAEEISGTEEKIGKDGSIIPAKKGLFPPPLKMEFEKAMRFFGIAKKKYAALLINEDGEFIKESPDGPEKILTKGIVIARRDNFPFLRNVYKHLLLSILKMDPIDEVYRTIIDSVMMILRNQLNPRENLTIVRGLGSDYKSDGFFMKVFADELSRMSHQVLAGDRLEYVVVKGPPKMPLGRRMRLIEMYEESQKLKDGDDVPEFVYPKEEIDSEYYVTNGLQNPIDQLFNIGYIDVFRSTNLGDKCYTPVSKALSSESIKKPIKMISKILTDFSKLNKSWDETLNFIEKLPEWFENEIKYLEYREDQSLDIEEYPELDAEDDDEIY